MAALLQQLTHHRCQPLRFVPVDHGQSRASGQNVSDASRLFLFNGMPQLTVADGHHLAEWFPLRGRPAVDQLRRIEAMTAFQVVKLCCLPRRVRQQLLEC